MSDDGLGDGLAQIGLGVSLQLLQHHGGDLLRGVGLAVDGDLVVGAHLALDGRDGAVGIGDGLALGDLADHTLAVLGEGHDGRRGARALGIGDDDGLAAFQNGDAAVGSTQIDTDDFTHCNVLLYKKMFVYELIYIQNSFAVLLHLRLPCLRGAGAQRLRGCQNSFAVLLHLRLPFVKGSSLPFAYAVAVSAAKAPYPLPPFFSSTQSLRFVLIMLWGAVSEADEGQALSSPP